VCELFPVVLDICDAISETETWGFAPLVSERPLPLLESNCPGFRLGGQCQIGWAAVVEVRVGDAATGASSVSGIIIDGSGSTLS
jgi:hypothetical protein